MIDLHTHSNASDGDYSPEELINLAALKSLKALALTDHDTIKGLEEAEYYAKKRGICFIPGIELESEFSPGDFHILGLNLKNRKGSFLTGIKELQDKRLNRNLTILRKMNNAGIEANYGEIEKYATGLVGRPHFAKYLIEKGIVSTFQEAFDRFLGSGKPFYTPKETYPLEEIIFLIHSGGGRAVVAHPLSLRLSLAQIEELLPAWKKAGLEGIEAYHPNAKPSYCKKLEVLSRKYGFFVSAGSDFHGLHRPERKLGRTTTKNKAIPDLYLEELLAWQAIG